jgi:hypothetical protein
MSASHESNVDVDIFRYVGVDFAVDVYLEFYGGQLGATIRSGAETAGTRGSGFPLETFLAVLDDTEAPSLPGLMATTDAAAVRLVKKLAGGVEYVLHKLEHDPAGVFRRASERNSLYGRDFQLRPLRAAATKAWAAADWRSVIQAYNAIRDLKPAVELLPSELAKFDIARKNQTREDSGPT